MKDIDEYKLGKNLFANSNEANFSMHHSAICNGCRGPFSSSNTMCQRYICLSYYPGIYRTGGFRDFDYKCITNLREKKEQYGIIIHNNIGHDDEKHVYLMVICQVSSYKDY